MDRLLLCMGENPIKVRVESSSEGISMTKYDDPNLGILDESWYTWSDLGLEEIDNPEISIKDGLLAEFVCE